MRLSQLRELARHLGVARYSNMLREQLIGSILGLAPKQAFSDFPLADPSVNASAEVLLSAVPTPLAAVPIQPPAVPAQEPSTTPEDSIAEQEDGPVTMVITGSPTWVSFHPQDPQWASIRWGISPEDRQTASAAGYQQLIIRLTDVTDRPAGDAHPHTLQEVVVDAGATEWHLPIPLGDRDYRVELGYRTSTGGWHSLVVSSVTRMPAEVDGLIPSPISFSLADSMERMEWPSHQPVDGIHERLYQQASAARRRLGLGSEAFQEEGSLLHGVPIAAGDHSSGIGLWASGREASGAGMAARQRSFWLVADAELIVYGATDPSATLTVADQTMPLSNEGTFRLHMAFPDGEQNYPIRALACDGEQQRSITLDFCRTTPDAKVNRPEDAVPEWF